MVTEAGFGAGRYRYQEFHEHKVPVQWFHTTVHCYRGDGHFRCMALDTRWWQRLDMAYMGEKVALFEDGCVKLARRMENTKGYEVSVAAAINMFATDSDAEMRVIWDAALKAGAFDAVGGTHHAHGSYRAAFFFTFVFFIIQSIVFPADSNTLTS